MDFHAFMYVTIGRRHELERGMAGKDPVLYRRMLEEIAEYARICDATGWSGIGIPEHHLQVEGFELGQEPGLMAMFLGQHGPRLRINQFGYVLPTHNPLRVAEHAATLDHLLGAAGSTSPSCAATSHAGSRTTPPSPACARPGPGTARPTRTR